MNALILFFYGILGAFLQSTFFRDLFPLDFVPDIMLLFVLYASLSFAFGRGLILCFLLGLIADLFSGAPSGWNALFVILYFILIKGIQARIFLKGLRGAFALLLLAFSLKLPYFVFLSTVFGFSFPCFKETILIWLGELFASLLLMPFLFYIISRSLGIQDLWILQNQKIRSQ